MEQLRDDLHGVGLTFDHTVHVKSFLGDMAQAGRLQEIVAEFFGDAVSPPQVVTEWLDAGAPAEIELVAVAPPRDAGTERLAYIEPIASRFSRVVRVDSGRPVFVSGLHGSAVEPVIQVREAFAELQDILRKAGSDMRHLVKATYYVADRGADQEINVIRPTLYDAQRPPAASKISVRGTGRAGKGSMMDMIAIMVDP
jgi:enamine deaminase RidA (YjgF/YER057c/UK114 family)